MDRNILAYWRRLQNDPGARPSPRVCRLLQATFESWTSKQPWPSWDCFGHLSDHVKEWEALSVIERKGLAVQKTLEILHELPDSAGACRLHPDELILGTAPPYSVGQGKELMRYLTSDESLAFELSHLNEWSPFGHICPNYETLLRVGIGGLSSQIAEHASTGVDSETAAFYRSVSFALEGVASFIEGYAAKARALSLLHAEVARQYDTLVASRDQDDHERISPETNSRDLAKERASGLEQAAIRLSHVSRNAPRTLLEACQLLYSFHIALHWTGDITSIGRLDQILWRFYDQEKAAGTLTEEEAQEVIDCLWLKLDERVVLDRTQAEDRFTDADGALLGSGAASNFDQGALLNQWMQQVTLGGYVANNDASPTDATNALTYMMLASSRRMPLNSPTLDLRLHRNSPEKLLDAAAQTLLSGGAHPVLMNDDRIVPALHKRSGGRVDLADARNYACDGCYETHFPGQTDFSFGFVPALDVLEKALNSGAGLGAAGSIHLRGGKESIRTKPASEIESWDEFWSILTRHIDLGAHRFVRGILAAYGTKKGVAPSPLLSAIVDGCLESGRDFAGGGARYHVFAPLMTGISTAADSLFVIRKLVFEDRFCSLEELVACLRTDWGHRDAALGLAPSQARIEEIWDACKAQPKFGTGQACVDQHAWELIDLFCDKIEEARSHRVHAAEWERLRAEFGTNAQPFELLFTPGVGTFEQYVFGGVFIGATPDGRRAGAPIASDLSPSPLHAVEPEQVPLRVALRSFAHPVIDRLSDGAPADLNIDDAFPVAELIDVLRTFASGAGGNMLTITVASPEALQGALEAPAEHELVRVRMGGWTEFLRALSPEHIAQHRSRRLYGSETSNAREGRP